MPSPSTKALAPFRWFTCNDPAFASLCAEAIGDYAKPSRGRKPEVRREAIARLLAAMVAGGPSGRPVAIALREHTKEPRRHPKGHRKALEALVAAGWAENPVRSNPTGAPEAEQDTDDKRKRSTRLANSTPGGYCLSAKSWEYLKNRGFDPSSPRLSKERLVMVKQNGAPIEPPTHPYLESWREQLDKYNRQIRGYEMTIDGEHVKPREFMLHRVFNSGDYTKGGRFYSHFQGRAGCERARLRIDGESVISFDCQALHARLSLACAGIELAPEVDPYLLPGHIRQHVKAVWNAGLNVNNKTGRSPSITEELLLVGANAEGILLDIKAAYPGIDKVIGRGFGLRFQRAESEAVEVLLDAFQSAGRPLVPIHDGYLIAESDQALFAQVLPRALDAIHHHLRNIQPSAVRCPLPVNAVRSYQR